MAFDQDKFRQLAKEQGYSDDEIDAHLGKLSAATGKPFGESSEELAKQAEQELRQAGQTMPSTEPKSQTTLEKFFDWSATPLGTATLGLGAIGIGAAAKKGLQNRKSAPVEQPKIEPVFTPEPVKTIPTQPAPADKLQELAKRVEAGKQAGLGVQPPAQPGPTYNVPTANVPGMPPAVQPPVQAPVQAPMGAVPAPQTTPAIADAVATGESPAKSIQMDIAKQIEAESVAPEAGVKKRAAKTTINFKSPEKLPSDITFRADLGPGDNWLFNTYGPEGRKAILSQFNEGKPAVSYERAKELSQMLQQERVGPAIPRDIAKERGIAPPETNYGKLGKAIKVAGAAGLGLTAAQMAQAAQQAREGDYSAAREFGFNLIGMIPGLASAFNLGTYAPELGAGEQKELAKRKRMAPTID